MVGGLASNELDTFPIASRNDRRSMLGQMFRRFGSRGMVQVRGVTYRVERVEPHHYEVVRLIDDVGVGSFRTLPTLRLHPVGCDDALFAEVVRAALRFARTSGMLRAVTPPEPQPSPSRRSPSSMPPSPVPV